MSLFVAGFLVAAGALLVGWRHLLGFRFVRRDGRNQTSPRGLGDQRVLVEAVASWTEGLRDAISGSSGIEQAIITTGQFSPEVIAPQVGRLVASLRYEPLATSLRRFSSEVGHPTCDFVVVALLTAAENQTRDLSQLLSHLSECARSECESYLRIWVSRARTRSSVRIITWSVTVFVAGLLLFNRAYLAPYASLHGGLVATLVLLTFAVSLVWMHRIAQVHSPSRLFASTLSGPDQ